MKTKCILFDADGVIIDSENFGVAYQKDFGMPKEKMLPFIKGPFQECLVGALDLKEAIKPYLQDWGRKGSVEELLDYRFKAEHSIDQRIVADIHKLKGKGIKVCLATKQEQYRTDYIRSEMEFDKIFHEIYSSAEIKYKKPNPKFFEHILNELSKTGIKKTDVLFIDDQEENIKSANEVGLMTHHYKGYDEKYKAKIELLLNDRL